MRRFSARYLEDTRRGMWDGSRDALAPLELDSHELIVDVGAGTGELTAVLTEESPATVVAVDRDRSLLQSFDGSGVQSDAMALGMADDTADLVVCQALLINLPDPGRALGEFKRCSNDRVGAIEPDNSQVHVESSVGAETRLTRNARDDYITGVTTDVALGDASTLFEDTGFENVETRRYNLVRTIEPPYDERAIRAAKRKATASRLATQRETLLAGGMTVQDYEQLREDWREMGRSVVKAMQNETYNRRETIPFYVTTGTVPENA
ncbi:class I SAM-dependent methyltransferase [Halocatena halophila]|uniref:class I SAM-dependent methyltransferase n=1 Tax=Halocatena halophila TaxID=2814576 RepID=UPI002ED100F7